MYTSCWIHYLMIQILLIHSVVNWHQKQRQVDLRDGPSQRSYAPRLQDCSPAQSLDMQWFLQILLPRSSRTKLSFCNNHKISGSLSLVTSNLLLAPKAHKEIVWKTYKTERIKPKTFFSQLPQKFQIQKSQISQMFSFGSYWAPKRNKKELKKCTSISYGKNFW